MKGSEGNAGMIVPKGMCISPKTAYFTTDTGVYGLRKTAENVEKVQQFLFNLANPQGCTQVVLTRAFQVSKETLPRALKTVSLLGDFALGFKPILYGQ